MTGYFVGVYEHSEKIPVKNIEERLASLAMVEASELALRLCRVVE